MDRQIYYGSDHKTIGDPEQNCHEDFYDRRYRLRGDCEALDKETEDCQYDGKDCVYREIPCPMRRW